MNSAANQRFVLTVYAGLGCFVILAATVLAGLHDLDPQATTAIFGFAVGLLGGVGGSLVTFGQATNGKAIVPTEKLAEVSANQAHMAEQLASLHATVHTSLAATGEGTLSPKTPGAGTPKKT